MVRKIWSGNRNVDRRMMRIVACTLVVAAFALLTILGLWLFLPSFGDAGEDNMAFTPKGIEIEESQSGEDVLQEDVEATWPQESTEDEPESEPQQDPYTFTELDETLYAQTSLRVRGEPSIEGDKIGGLYLNQKVKITGRCNETGWYRIDYYGNVGYASDLYLAAEPVELDITQSVGGFAAVDKSYYDNVLFIGDSLTVGLSMYGSLKNATYFCVNGMGADEALGKSMDGITLDSLLDNGEYDAIYIMLGINDMGLKRKSFLSVYSNLLGHVQEKQPDACIVIQSILAVTSSYTAEHPKINNEEIRERNAKLAELADGENIFYLDLNTYFIDEAGNLKESQARDGLHLASKSYRVWKDALLANGIVK